MKKASSQKGLHDDRLKDEEGTITPVDRFAFRFHLLLPVFHRNTEVTGRILHHLSCRFVIFLSLWTQIQGTKVSGYNIISRIANTAS